MPWPCRWRWHARSQPRDAPLTVPAGQEFAQRRSAALQALRLMFNAGWQAYAERARELRWDAIRLAQTKNGAAVRKEFG